MDDERGAQSESEEAATAEYDCVNFWAVASFDGNKWKVE